MLIGMRRKIYTFLINKVYVGTKYYDQKNLLMRKLGHVVGEGTKIVGPVFCTGKLIIGKNCWIGKNLFVNGNGSVFIEDNCDIAPEVIFQTGGHSIGSSERRAGKGYNRDIIVGRGSWIGARCTILGGVKIGEGCVIAACACVTKDTDANLLIGGVPAKMIKMLES